MSTRLIYIVSLLTISLLLLTGLYLQVFQGIMPCPLCSLQRLTFGLLGVIFLMGIFLYKESWQRLSINLLAVTSSIIGMFLAGRQIWLQHFPPAGQSECGVDIQYMFEVLPIGQFFQKILAGGVECSERGWEFFYLNIAEWSFLWFSLFFLASLYLFFKEIKK